MTDHTCDHDEQHGIDRRGFVRGCGAAMALSAAGIGPASFTASAQAETNYGDVGELLNDAPDNWGRWGDDDELGALNLLGSEQAFDGMKAAMRGGRRGIQTFTLQVPLTGEIIFDPAEAEPDPTSETGDPVFPGRAPARRNNVQDEGSYRDGEVEPQAGMRFSDDRFINELFLQGTTHVDALAHAWYAEPDDGDESRIYNGFDAATTGTTKQFDRAVESCEIEDGERVPVDETRGHERAGIGVAADEGIVGRAVLLDVGRELGEDGRLPLGHGITYDDLQATAEAQGTQFRERDIVFVRTGAMARTRDPDLEWSPLTEPGLVYSEELVEWIAEMDFPMIGADNIAVEKVMQRHEVDGEEQTFVIPLHGALLRNLGVYLNEILWLDDLAEQCASDGIYEFLYTTAPLNVERSSGAPVNPVAVKATASECEGETGGRSADRRSRSDEPDDRSDG
ncbi:cyclase family protein [Natronomonas salina]|uniref:cyclase family protein n=1 Tax=Natronomonas salina TaxID=1710540 RepID=UPI0015B49A8C|nr:cyclase family protein [Natronomonas salina]QLD90823.1 cyclase family protein [Natronomonas salina]